MILGIAGVVALFGVSQQSGVDCSKPIDVRRRIDTTLVRSVDVDGDGRLDSVRLHVTAARFDAPFSYEMSIVSKGRVLIRHRQDNARMDFIFADSTLARSMGTYTTYTAFKCRWYFHDLLEATVDTAPSLGEGVFDRQSTGSVYAVARSYLISRCHAKPPAADQAIKRAVDRLRSQRAVVVFVIRELMISGEPMLWFSEFGCFAPIYRE